MKPKEALVDYTKATERELVKGVLNGDEGAETEYVRRFRPIVASIAWRFRSNQPGQEFQDLVNYGLGYMLTGYRLTTDGRFTLHRPPIDKWLEKPKGNLAGFNAACVKNLFVEKLTLWQLLDKKAQDYRVPGTCLASIEGEGILLIFPLSQFTEMQLALAAGSGMVASYNSAESSLKPEDRAVIKRRVFRYANPDITLDVLTDERDRIFLSAHSNRRL